MVAKTITPSFALVPGQINILRYAGASVKVLLFRLINFYVIVDTVRSRL